MAENVKMVIEVSKEIAEKYNGEQIEFFKRTAESKYGKMNKTIARLLDPVKDKDLFPARPNVANPELVRDIFPKLGQIFGSLQNLQIMSVLNLAMSAANLAATIKGFQEINVRLDHIEAQLSAIRQGIDDAKTIDYEMQIAKPCRSIVSQYKDISALYQKEKPISENGLISLLDESKEFIISMYNLRGVYSLQVALQIIFMMFPVFANCILMYYHRFYDANQHMHNRHSEWMEIFDLLSEPRFIEEIQDNLFITQRKTNKEVNEYLDCQRSIVYGYKLKIEDLLEDLKTCGSVKVYDEAMQWSRQFAAQQAVKMEADLIREHGGAKTRAVMRQVMQEIEVI